MDREEDFGAQSTVLQAKTKMRQNLIPSNFRKCARNRKARAQEKKREFSYPFPVSSTSLTTLSTLTQLNFYF